MHEPRIDERIQNMRDNIDEFLAKHSGEIREKIPLKEGGFTYKILEGFPNPTGAIMVLLGNVVFFGSLISLLLYLDSIK